MLWGEPYKVCQRGAEGKVVLIILGNAGPDSLVTSNIVYMAWETRFRLSAVKTLHLTEA
jgi:hypothetical protein